MPGDKKKIIRVTVDIFVEVPEDKEVDLNLVYTDLGNATIRHGHGGILGRIYDWETQSSERLD